MTNNGMPMPRLKSVSHFRRAISFSGAENASRQVSEQK